MSNQRQKIEVTSEIGTLRRVLIHSPDGGVGNVPTSKVHDWLYDDVVDVQQMQKEYNYFVIILLLFLDIDKLFDSNKFLPDTVKFNPERTDYFGKDLAKSCVIDTQICLASLFAKLENEQSTKELISSISAIEGLNIDRKRDLENLYNEALDEYKKPSKKTATHSDFRLGKSKFMDLAKTLITGKLEKGKPTYDVSYVFPPIANFIFTRDIGVTIKGHIFITNPRFNIRKREVVLLKFITEHYLSKGNSKKIIEIGEDDDFFQIEEKFKEESRVSFEGGDIMIISENHILIGCSERTSPYAIQKFIHRVYKDKLAQIISVIKISEKRSQMHIDTILSHIRKDTWIIFGQLSEQWQEGEKSRSMYADSIRQKSENEIRKEELVTVIQFCCGGDYDATKNYQVYSEDEIKLMLLKGEISERKAEACQIYGDAKLQGFKYTKPKGLKDLLEQISVNDFGVKSKDNVTFIYSGGGVSPHDEREQWTDACNLLVIREGIAIGYDRNKKTAEAFENLMLDFGFDEKTPSRRKLETRKKNQLASKPHLRAFLTWLTARKNKIKNKQDKKIHPYELNLHVIHATDLIEYFREYLQDTGDAKEVIKSFINNLENTLILLPSNELSRARGGSHCMTMPLLRDQIK